jgi:hypothetical protein
MKVIIDGGKSITSSKKKGVGVMVFECCETERGLEITAFGDLSDEMVVGCYKALEQGLEQIGAISEVDLSEMENTAIC